MKKNPEHPWWAEIAVLQKQKEVLRIREHMLNHSDCSPKNLEKINNETMDDLKKVSPEKLVSVAFYSVEHGWMLGYLMQKVGRGGARILVKLKTWRILRVRTSAVIHKIKPAKENLFIAAALMQEQSNITLSTLLVELGVKEEIVEEELPKKKSSRKSA